MQLDNTVEVETPEHLGLRFHVAGPTRRGWAYLVDLLLRLAALMLFEMVSVLATGSRLHWSRRLASGVTLLALFVVEWGYFVLFETVGNGRTPGKRLLRLRVVREDGYPLSFADAVLRNLLRAADFLPVGYLLGLVVMSWDVRFARLGDRAAGTMVVSEDAPQAVPVVVVDPRPTAAELGQMAMPFAQRGRAQCHRALARTAGPVAGATEGACRYAGVCPGCAPFGQARPARARRPGSLPGLALSHVEPEPGALRRGRGPASPGEGTLVMRSQNDFVAVRKPAWDELDTLLARKPVMYQLAPAAIARAASLYREICADLMRARAAGYSADLVEVLDALATRGAAALYSVPPYRLSDIGRLVVVGFPCAVRRQARFVAIAATLFVLPGILGFVGASRSRGFAIGLMSQAMVEQMEESYRTARTGMERSTGSTTTTTTERRDQGAESMMAAFYVYNNIGIAFRCFATGILFGLGSVFFLVYNGLLIGAVAGLVTTAGHGRNLLTFMVSHGAFELTAIVISGAAGLVMGYALVDAGSRTRWASLRARAGDLFRMIMGAALLLLLAAAVEGYWSPAPIPPAVKLGVAPLLYALVVGYLLFAGRQGEARAGRQGGQGDET